MRAKVGVLIENGRITAIDDSSVVRSDASTLAIDAFGKFLVPGYNDMHSHVLELDEPSGALALMLAEGVTGFRQMSGSPQRLEERRTGALPVADADPAALQMPGTILTPLNAGSPDSVVAEIRRQKAQGADFIKSGMMSPEVFLAALHEARDADIPLLGHLQDGVDAATAAQLGFRSVEHLGPGATIWTACSNDKDRINSEAPPPLRIGPLAAAALPLLRPLIMRRFQTMLVNPIAFVRPEYALRLKRAIDSFSERKFRDLAELFVATGTWHVPTLVRLRTQALATEYENSSYFKYMPEASANRWRQVTDRFRKLPSEMRMIFADAYPKQLQLTKRLADSGVRMMTGTDGGWLAGPGLTLKDEFAELGKAGLSALQILQMATVNAAEYLGRTDTMGTVAIGQNADLVLLNSDPLRSVENLHDIAGVVRGGKYHSREELEALKARVAAGGGYLR